MTVGCAGAGISDTGGSLTFSGFGTDMVLAIRKDFHYNPCLDPTLVPF